jgi:hypothetical protein
MKRITALIAVAGLALCMTGCVAGCHKTAPPAWALTAPERTVGDVIYSANTAVVKYEADVTAGESYTANPMLKKAMQDIQKSLAIAQPAYNTWNSALKVNPNTPEPANLVGAIAAIQNLLSQLPSITK